MLLGIIIGCLGVFRYQEMASLAREASRYASCHGAQWRKDAGAKYSWTSTQIYSFNPGTTASTNPFGSDVLAYEVQTYDPAAITIPTSDNESADKTWTQDIYDNAINGKTFFLDPLCRFGGSQAFIVKIGWKKLTQDDGTTVVLVSGSAVPDNYPGSRVHAEVQYPVFPEWIWNIGSKSVSTAPMPITN